MKFKVSFLIGFFSMIGLFLLMFFFPEWTPYIFPFLIVVPVTTFAIIIVMTAKRHAKDHNILDDYPNLQDAIDVIASRFNLPKDIMKQDTNRLARIILRLITSSEFTIITSNNFAVCDLLLFEFVDFRNKLQVATQNENGVNLFNDCFKEVLKDIFEQEYKMEKAHIFIEERLSVYNTYDAKTDTSELSNMAKCFVQDDLTIRPNNNRFLEVDYKNKDIECEFYELHFQILESIDL